MAQTGNFFDIANRLPAVKSPVRLISKVIERGRLFVVALCLYTLHRIGKKELQKMNSKMASEMALELSIQGVQMLLDKEGLAHCAHCQVRAPLRKVNGEWMCNRHFSIFSQHATPTMVIQ